MYLEAGQDSIMAPPTFLLTPIIPLAGSPPTGFQTDDYSAMA